MAENQVPQNDKGRKWFWPIMTIITIIALLWILMRSCSKNIPVSEATDIPTPVAPAEDRPKATETKHLRESMKVKIANGNELDAFKDGLEIKLIQFLSDQSAKAPEDGLFYFDDLTFENGNAKLTAGCKRQIGNLAEILKAYPSLQIEIAGYTDASGNVEADQSLSQERAASVVMALKALDVNADQLSGSQGYGSKYAKASANASEEEKANDRRIALSVKKK